MYVTTVDADKDRTVLTMARCCWSLSATAAPATNDGQ